MKATGKTTDGKTARASKITKDNLATAQTADGMMTRSGSVYEILGIAKNHYGNVTFAQYQEKIRAMRLYELQQHCLDVSVLPSHSDKIMIDRLEEEFLKRNRKARAEAVDAANDDTSHLSAKEQAERYLRRVTKQG
jgi:hypothetical protein